MPFDGQNYETVAKKMLALFAGGTRWLKHRFVDIAYTNDRGEGVYGFCLMGAYSAVKYGEDRVIKGKTYADISIEPEYQLLVAACRKKALLIYPPSLSKALRENLKVFDVNDDTNTNWRRIEEILQEMHNQEIAALVKK